MNPQDCPHSCPRPWDLPVCLQPGPVSLQLSAPSPNPCGPSCLQDPTRRTGSGARQNKHQGEQRNLADVPTHSTSSKQQHLHSAPLAFPSSLAFFLIGALPHLRTTSPAHLHSGAPPHRRTTSPALFPTGAPPHRHSPYCLHLSAIRAPTFLTTHTPPTTKTGAWPLVRRPHPRFETPYGDGCLEK